MADVTRAIELIVVHCSATRPSLEWGAADIEYLHRRVNGWSAIGYHYVIRRNGILEDGRQIDKPGAHVAGHNARSIGICLIGGVDDKGEAQANYTPIQYQALAATLRMLRMRYRDARICGHRDLSPDRNGNGIIEANEWLKQCPCFDVTEWCKESGIDPRGRT